MGQKPSTPTPAPEPPKSVDRLLILFESLVTPKRCLDLQAEAENIVSEV